ncbi:ABC-type multidrug transport system, ATPase component [Longilinea arvoryzae]|uniref:ABC-type multidrug transport system, ATPase component n=1 Tax=Longilinea arvoryzae TaxID=360412 RepID=A0A0S7B6I7_9CHLR|nr:FHA domain-containing protein [Longilinea arvoryzae]GAP12631.1 ABC-type multidrug transport system, ATPase component [Longilinea arvoryzae]
MEAPDQPRLVLREGQAERDSFPVDRPELIIGRDPSAEILIDSPGVSRRHARVYRQAGDIWLEDLGSRNGTFVNGERVGAPQRLNANDEIRLGQSVMLIFQQPPRAAETVLESAATQQQQIPQETVMEAISGVAATMIGDDSLLTGAPRTPPRLTITIAGEKSATYTLTQPEIRLGRASDNDIVIDSRIVSRYHAHLVKTPAGYTLNVLPEAANPILLEGRPVQASQPLENGDILRIGSLDPGLMVTLTYSEPVAAAAGEMQPIRFGEKALLQIGRDPGNDIVLSSPTVSRFHAQIERVGHRYCLRDLRSANGTFVNDQRIEKEVWLNENDTVRIGRHRFVMKQDQLDRFDDTRGLKVEAYGLNRWVRKDLNILQNISLCFQPRELVVVVGQSGGGKSTLINAIIGYKPATQGQVLVNGTNVYRNYDAVRDDMGYVPQRDIIHMGLTVYQALDYTARLRMPRDTSKAERHKRILEVLEDLDLLHRKDSPISKLSGGQQKRVSIGVELLTSPGLFFLDEPTSGLDPGTETAFMHLMRRLADQGRTIVLVTHATKNVMLADKVVFLARGGYLAWFGPPDEALAYFDSFRSEREKRVREMEFDQIYAILDDSSKGSAQEWAKRYTETPFYQKYVVEALKQAKEAHPVATPPEVKGPKTAAPKPKRKKAASGLSQFLILSARNLRILIRDRSSLILMLLAAPAVAALDFVIAPLMGSAPFDYNTGDAANGSITLFLMTIYCLLVAGLSQMREFVKEEDIYKRERLVNLQIVPYVASKVWVALLLAFYHAAAYTVIHYLAFKMPGTLADMGLVYVTMVLAAMAGMVCGLLASALAPAASSAPMVMILLLVPQIVLSGALAPVPENVSAIASTRWAFEGLIGIVGYGSDVAADPCWELPEDLRDAMTLEDKAAAGCRCMGTAIFTPGSCNFPGVGQYFVPEVDQPEVAKPADLPAKPAEPVIPDAPKAPTDQNDQVQMVQYLNALKAYQDEVTLIQNAYKDAMSLYESQAKVYQAEMEAYQEDVLKYESARNSAVERAEGVIDGVKESFGWGWVDKSNPAVFRAWLTEVWGAQGILIGVFIVIILILIKRKDNA